MLFYKHIIFIILLTLTDIVLAQSSDFNDVDEVKQLSIQAIDRLVKQDREALVYDEVTKLSSKIILNRQQYSNDTVAKAFILLTDIAINQSELDRAFQFAEDGLMLKVNNSQLKLCLLLRKAAVYSTKSKYSQLLEITQRAYDLAKKKDDVKYALLALSYRSVAYALLGDHQKALLDLQQVEQLITANPKFADHIEILSILASAHSYLGDFQAALTIQLKVLKLRFDLNKMQNIDQTYYQLASAYLHLNQLDDAYNAYSESKFYAEKKHADIGIAYAARGLGNVLLQQHNYEAAYQQLIQAKTLFKGQNLTKAYIETLVALIKVRVITEKKLEANQLLVEAESLLKIMVLEAQPKALYLLLANSYSEQKKFKEAYYWLSKYNQFLQQNYQESLTAKALAKHTDSQENITASEQAKQLSIKLAEKSELTAYYATKYKRQKYIIYSLAILCISLIIWGMWQWFKWRAKQQHLAYEEIEKPAHLLANPRQTKQLYQLAYKKARKFEYPLTVGYFSIDNWTELTFRFNKKTVTEVSKAIAVLINEHLGEFDYAGLINEGEYLLLYPHQSIEESAPKIERLEQALKVRFFANLGDFSVNINFALETPNFQDIDPYIFLSRLSEAVHLN